MVGECILSRGENSKREEVGVINRNGAYSQYVIMPGNFIHKIPENLDSKKASLAEPLAVALRALRRIKSRLFPEATVAVVGAGPIGNLCAQVLTLEGYKVSVFDKSSQRLELLKNKVCSVSTSLDSLERFDVIIEATGSEQVLKQILKDSGTNSTVLFLGFPYGKVDYNFEDLVGYEKMFIGSVGAEHEDFVRALDLLSKLDVSEFIKKIFPLKDFKEAWEMHTDSKHIKILLKP